MQLYEVSTTVLVYLNEKTRKENFNKTLIYDNLTIVVFNLIFFIYFAAMVQYTHVMESNVYSKTWFSLSIVSSYFD